MDSGKKTNDSEIIIRKSEIALFLPYRCGKPRTNLVIPNCRTNKKEANTTDNVNLLHYYGEARKARKAKVESEDETEAKSFQEEESQQFGRFDQIDGKLQCLLQETRWACQGTFE
jgi:hypothetical protein